LDCLQLSYESAPALSLQTAVLTGR
jgi:hypothetical protein